MRKSVPITLVCLAMLGLTLVTAVHAASSAGTDAVIEKPAANAAPQRPARTATPKLRGVDDLQDKRVGALLGSAHVDYVANTWPRAALL